tara:strand:+ start:320 stop:769 length:450 start_codon:yes stop_codon:yes gene_type:complete
MYHSIVKSIIKRNFDALTDGNFDVLLQTVADDVDHTFLGHSAIGGQRKSKEKLRLWFERLFRLFPNLSFTVQNIIVTGFPWHTRIAAEWEAEVTPKSGTPYTNTGVHMITLKWGKAVKIKAYENAELVANACNTMLDNGIKEAGAEQIT